MNIDLGSLAIGTWRDLTEAEVQGLREAVSESDNSSFVDQTLKHNKTNTGSRKETKQQFSRNTTREVRTNGRRRRGRNT